MLYIRVVIVLLATIEIQRSQTAKILSIFGHQGPSQYVFVEPLLVRLAERGHFVTSITNFPQNGKHDNLRSIVVSENEYLYEANQNFTTTRFGKDHFDVNGKIFSNGFQIGKNIIENSLVLQMMENEKFDVILLDLIFSESLYGLVQHFEAPIVGISTIGSTLSVDALMGNSGPLSYVASLALTQRYNENMDFRQRCLNLLSFIFGTIYYHYEYMPVNRKFYRQHFPNATKTMEDIQQQFASILLNDHYAISTPRPYVPNMIEVAGLHIPENPEPLPQDITSILNNLDSQGFIYVAIENLFPHNIMKALFKQFEMLNETIVWNAKHTPSSVLLIPANVKIFTNFSHFSILGHRNCKLLISHGSHLSVIESIHYGVPIIGLTNANGNPGELFNPVDKIETGVTLKIGTKSLQNNQIYQTILNVLQNDTYIKLAKLKSIQFRDQQNTPMQRAIFWVEYVIRHNGADHLRNLGQNLNTVQFYNIDVWLFICLIVFVTLVICYYIVNVILKCLRKFHTRKYKNE
ncbi:UDP-glucosyltransferase 2-like [Musca autumnalis]|uniref:UDP-glucosyltransferase 2-like n=1 Tax=Musca autumnalis TaxID=221902 RepID=UPI003CE683E4